MSIADSRLYAPKILSWKGSFPPVHPLGPKSELLHTRNCVSDVHSQYHTPFRHIPVAIKVLRHPLDDLDPTMVEDFQREVKFMRCVHMNGSVLPCASVGLASDWQILTHGAEKCSSIRHPHVLNFYGAGVDGARRAFLVTELMQRGSLKSLLLDLSQELSWGIRVRFASDIAQGMRYLHEKGTVHRDLKADNCEFDFNSSLNPHSPVIV